MLPHLPYTPASPLYSRISSILPHLPYAPPLCAWRLSRRLGTAMARISTILHHSSPFFTWEQGPTTTHNDANALTGRLSTTATTKVQ